MLDLPLLPLSILTTILLAVEAVHVRAPVNAISRSNTSVSLAWYAGWHASDFPLSNVTWSKYTHMTYAFATTTPDVSTLSLEDSDEQLLPSFVSSAHQNSVKAILSIGGWTGSRWFSTNVGTPSNRTAFVQTVTNLVEKYSLDGLDFDWEFPSTQGIGCNEVNSNDTTNFLAFLRQLRNSTAGRNLVLSAATYVTPWVDGTTNTTSANISDFSQVLDFIEIMNYDIHSNPSVGAGSSSPLDDSCAPPGARLGSAMSAVQAWMSAGMPANQIVLGVPAYGHSFVVPSVQTATVSGSDQYPMYNASIERRGDSWDDDGGLDVCGATVGPGGVYTYWGLMQQGYLNQDGSPAQGIEFRFDNCSQTPFLYNSTAQIYVSYEDQQSFAIKGGFIHSMGLKGFAMWEAGGDSKDALLDSILNATQNGGPPGTSKTQGNSTSTTSSDSSAFYDARSSVWHSLLIFAVSLSAWLAL